MTIRNQALLTLYLVAGITACVAAYWTGLDGPFILDDSSNINQAVITESSFESWVQAAFSNSSGRLGRPVSAASFAFTSLFHGLNAESFKYHNLLIHLLIGILLWPLGAMLLRRLSSRLSATSTWYIAGTASILWLLHPLLVSTTLYAVQRMTQLAVLFLVVALLCYVFFRSRLHQRPVLYGVGMAATVGTAGLFGIFSKENAALLPFYLIAIEAIVFRGQPAELTERHSCRSAYTENRNWLAGRRVLIAFQIFFVLIPLTAALVYVVSNWPDFMRGYNNRVFSLEDRLLTEAHALWFYVKGILLPRAVEMSLLHDAYPIQSDLSVTTIVAIAGHAILITAGFALARHARTLSFGIAVFYISHLLESTFIPLELVFEHRNYFAAWGLLLALTYYIYTGFGKVGRMKWMRHFVFISLMAIFAINTQTRALTWKSEEHIYLSTLKMYPTSGRALSGLANIHLQYREIDLAREYLKKAQEHSPNQAGPSLHLLFTYCESESYPQELYDTIRGQLRKGFTTAYAKNSIYSISALTRKGKCPILTTEDVTRLLLDFLGNDNLDNEARYYTMIELGRTYLYNNKAKHAREVFINADTLRTSVRHPDRLFALDGIVFSSLAMNDTDSAIKTLEKISALQDDPRLASTFNTSSILDTMNEINTEDIKFGLKDKDS